MTRRDPELVKIKWEFRIAYGLKKNIRDKWAGLKR